MIGSTKLDLVIDTGAAVSILPPNCITGINLSPTEVKISSAGGQTIKCHGECYIEIKIPQLRRNFFWRFIVADVTIPLLGADFLSSHDLLINCRRRKLLDITTNREANGIKVDYVCQIIIKNSPVLHKEINKLLITYPALTSSIPMNK